MNKNKGVVIALVIGVCAIICTSILSFSFLFYKKSGRAAGITATGSASCNFESDLIVWRGNFSATGYTSGEAYGVIKQDAEEIKNYLLSNGVTEEEMVFSSVNIYQNSYSQYTDNGDYIGEVPGDYNLSQDVTITSSDIDKVEKISRDISALIESGVEFSSYEPEYYYTKLDELKLQLIEQATQNAKERVEIMASGADGKIGNMLSANLGVFQITAQNSADEDYSSGGTFNTSSRDKTATITVKLNYAVR